MEGHALHFRPDTAKADGDLPQGRVVKSGDAVFTVSGFASQAGIKPGPRETISIFTAMLTPSDRKMVRQ